MTTTMAQKLKMYDVVKLKEDRPAEGLTAGVVGTVLMIHGDDKAYEVEFVDDGGESLAVVTVPPDDVEFVQSGE